MALSKINKKNFHPQRISRSNDDYMPIYSGILNEITGQIEAQYITTIECQALIDLTTFITLADTPADYTGQSGRVAAVKATEDGLEFIRVDLPRAQVFGVAVDFLGEKVYNKATAPITGNITIDQTGAVLGIVQKMYHNDAVSPTITGVSDVQIIGTGTYVLGALNIIYLEWTETDRVEYWITQEG
tara:strand:- start:35 stop:592 length:558 start_codon:yes stop_codon:yes gene_type:complete